MTKDSQIPARRVVVATAPRPTEWDRHVTDQRCPRCMSSNLLSEVDHHGETIYCYCGYREQ